MYRVDRNNFYENTKVATIYTPEKMSALLFEILSPQIRNGLIFDPCVGQGSLLKPWMNGGYSVLGVDIEEQGFENTIVKNYLTVEKGELATPSLVIMNPPFNIDDKTKDYIKATYGSRPLLPEIWLLKAIELFGKNIPMAMFTPYGFRLNQTVNSKRWQRFQQGDYPEISSIISLPKDLFEGILFHSEVLIFNVKGLKGHYFYDG